MGKFIAIASAKGGVGKTTTVLNLGTALTLFGRTTLVVDGDLDNPCLSLHLGVGHISPTISEVMSGEIPLSEAVFRHQSGLYVTAARLHEEITPNWSRLKDLKKMADFVFVDTSSRLDNELLDLIDMVLLVTSPDLPAIAATLKTIRKVSDQGVEIIGVIVNRRHNDVTELSLYDVRQLLEVPILGYIPDDIHVRKSLKISHPVVFLYPDAPSSVGYKKIAAHLLGQSYETHLDKQEESWYKWFTQQLKI